MKLNIFPSYSLKVVVGQYLLNETLSTKTRLEVSHFRKHPNFNPSSTGIFIHDLGLIFLKKKLKFNEFIQPVQLVSDTARIKGNQNFNFLALRLYHCGFLFIENTPALFYGWGEVFPNINTDRLKKAKLNIIEGKSIWTITNESIENCPFITDYEFFGGEAGKFTNLCPVG